MLLSLPVIAPGVPATIEFSPAGERHLRLVLAMSRLGMITDDDLASLRRTRMTTSAIRTLIERGWHRAIGGDYTYQMISAYARLLLPDAADEDFIGSDGTPLIGFAIVIGKADKVAGVRIMEADFPGETAYIGNFQQGMKIILHSTDFKRFVHGGLLCFYLLCPL